MIRFCKILSAYPRYLINLYETNPALKDSSYSEQMLVLEEDGFGCSDFWQKNLKKIGGFETRFILVNAEHAQKKWAKENNFRYDENNWAIAILMEQLQVFGPEVIFANDYNLINPTVVSNIRKEVPTVRLVIGWDGIDLRDEQRFASYDIILSCNGGTVQHYKEHHIQSYYLLFGFEPSLLNRIKPPQEMYEVSFVGSLTLRKGGHHNRLKVLGEVARTLPLDCWLSDFDKPKLYFYKNLLLKLREKEYQDIIDCLRLSFKNREAVYALGMYEILAHSKFTLNTHIDVANQYAGNIRLFEATGVGTCLVTDFKPNISDIFIPDKEIVTYNSPEECVEKIKYLQNHESERAAIAAAGQKRTLETYSWEKRIRDFIPFMLDRL